MCDNGHSKALQIHVAGKFIAMFQSLYYSVIEAGGIPPHWDELKNMSMEDFFGLYAQNNIRFIYKKPQK